MKVSTIRRAFFSWCWVAAFMVSHPSHRTNAVAEEVEGDPSQSHFGPLSPRKLKETKSTLGNSKGTKSSEKDGTKGTKSSKNDGQPPGNSKGTKSVKKDETKGTKSSKNDGQPPANEQVSAVDVKEKLQLSNTVRNQLLDDDGNYFAGGAFVGNGEEVDPNLSDNVDTIIDPDTGCISETADYYTQSLCGKNFSVFYNVTLRQDLLSLTPLQDLISSVECEALSEEEATVEITFMEPLDDTTLVLFPQDAVLAVDGSVFGDCNLAVDSTIRDLDPDGVSGPKDGIGFVISVSVPQANTILVTLAPGGLTDMFKSIDLEINEVNAPSFASTQSLLPDIPENATSRNLAKIDFAAHSSRLN